MATAWHSPLLPERFWRRVTLSDDGCWLWHGGLFFGGYGSYFFNGKSMRAHRVTYTVLIGEIPTGLCIDHLCRVRHCVNPEHLEPVTLRENILRGESVSAKAAKVTHCPQEHPYLGENLRTAHGYRTCWECRRAYDRAYSKAHPRKRIRNRRKAEDATA